ncbi:hypothetical protein C1H46_001239 [Malus baccata]|uniref:Uncharacterized protein n=1 Tax=Malus baccata TaxID=106549 RepID=A0A540NQ54_MALBA|nr:hypothetical protein C1H46_001239 [Malus baccata]
MANLLINFEIDVEDLGTAYINRLWIDQFREWKYDLHNHYISFEGHEEVLTHLPLEFEHRMSECH